MAARRKPKYLTPKEGKEAVAYSYEHGVVAAAKKFGVVASTISRLRHSPKDEEGLPVRRHTYNKPRHQGWKFCPSCGYRLER